MSEEQKKSEEGKRDKIKTRLEDIKGGRERRESFSTLPELWKRKRPEEDEAREDMQECKRIIVKEVEEGTGKVEKMIEKMTEKIMGVMDKKMEDIRRELVEARKEMNKKQEEWKNEKEELEKRIKGIEEKMEREEGERTKDERWKDMEKRMEKIEKICEGKVCGDRKGGVEDLEGRIKGIEKSMQAKDRERRKRNVIVKGVKVGVGDMRKGVEKIMEDIGAEVKIGDIKRIKAGREEWGEMVCVELTSVEEKRRVMEKKSKLKGSKIWIDDDLSWEERRSREWIRGVVKEEREKGNRVTIGRYGIKINEVWWEWDMEKKILRKEIGRGKGEGEGQRKKEKEK